MLELQSIVGTEALIFDIIGSLQRGKQMKFQISLSVALLALAGMADIQAVPPDSIVVPANIIVRNPTTKICVDFGDVSHISPWQIIRVRAATRAGSW